MARRTGLWAAGSGNGIIVESWHMNFLEEGSRNRVSVRRCAVMRVRNLNLEDVGYQRFPIKSFRQFPIIRLCILKDDMVVHNLAGSHMKPLLLSK